MVCYVQPIHLHLHCSSSYSDLPQMNAQEEQSTYPIDPFLQQYVREFLHPTYIYIIFILYDSYFQQLIDVCNVLVISLWMHIKVIFSKVGLCVVESS